METGKGEPMYIRLIGAACVVAGCGGFGFRVAANYRLEGKLLREQIEVLDYMEAELNVRRTPLPDLCRQASVDRSSRIRAFYSTLANELESQFLPDVERCVASALSQNHALPPVTKKMLANLGTTLGKFNIDGQIKQLEACKSECQRQLEILARDKDPRIRSYQTLGLCAGAAVVILLL